MFPNWIKDWLTLDKLLVLITKCHTQFIEAYNFLCILLLHVGNNVSHSGVIGRSMSIFEIKDKV